MLQKFLQNLCEQDQHELNVFVDVIPSQVPAFPDEAGTPQGRLLIG